MKNIFSLLSLVILSFFNLQAANREIEVLVSPDHLDWNYRIGEKCTFTIRVIKAQNFLSDIELDYELGPEMYPVEKKKNVKIKNGEFKVTGKMDKPGFLRCKAYVKVENRTYEGIATVAYSPESLLPVTKMPDDFVSFWERTLENARRTPLKPIMTLLPERCTDLDNVYHVSFQTRTNGERFYGILSVPKKKGTYPALLRVPGAGVRPYSGDRYTGPGKLITLEVGVNGIPVNMDQSVYTDLMYGALKDYWTYRCDNRENYYYNRIIVGVVRAIDFIYSLPQFNGKALGVTGASQGGALSVIAAALDKRVTCVASVHPALCDHEAYFEKRACGWPHYFYYYEKPTQQKRETVRYYDVANFARLLNVPCWFSWGYNDQTCPPTSMFAAYNVISSQKELRLCLPTGHNWVNEQWEDWLTWLRMNLGI